MTGNLNRRIIGKCGICGAVVSVPTIIHSVKRPVPTCERCGAVADETASLPVIPMLPRYNVREWTADNKSRRFMNGAK